MSDIKEYTSFYDDQVKEYNSYGHDVLFGLTFPYVKSNEKILDLGIGTGLASINYANLGLKVYGLDSAQEMLDVCGSKSFTEELKLHNLNEGNIPFISKLFNHVVCCGVLHFIENLEPLFNEVSRVIKKGGIFSFTFALNNSDNDYEKEETDWGIPIYSHSTQYIENLLKKYGFSVEKEQRLLTKGPDKATYKMLFSAILAESV